jgi:hypothetical protein
MRRSTALRLTAFAIPWVAALVLTVLGTFPIKVNVLMAAGITLLLMPYALSQRAIRENTLLISVAAGLAIYYLSPLKTDEIKFYEITAQIVPILFLALAVELGAFRYRRGIPDTQVGGTMMVFLIGAEIECLRVITNGNAKSGAFSAVIAVLVAATVGLVFIAITGLPEQPEESTGTTQPSQLSSSHRPFRLRDSLAILIWLLILRRRHRPPPSRRV